MKTLLVIALIFSMLFAVAQSRRVCRRRPGCQKRLCPKKLVSVRRRRRKTRVVTRYKYVNVAQKRRVCYMKKKQENYSFLSYYSKKVKVRQYYLKRVRYTATEKYMSKKRKSKVVKRKKYYNKTVRRRRIDRRRRKKWYTRLVTRPRRCRKAYTKYYHVFVNRPYKTQCRYRKEYYKTERYRSTCRRRVPEKYQSNQMVPFGNCYKKKIKTRWVWRFVKCTKTRRVKRYRWALRPCTKWRKVRVRRRKVAYKWGLFCTKKVPKRFWRWESYTVVVFYNVVVRRFRWVNKTVYYWVPVVKTRKVTRTKLVVRSRLVVRYVRAVKRVTRKRWTMVPAFKWNTYYVKKLRSYTVRKGYWHYYVVKVWRRPARCVQTKICLRYPLVCRRV